VDADSEPAVAPAAPAAAVIDGDATDAATISDESDARRAGDTERRAEAADALMALPLRLLLKLLVLLLSLVLGDADMDEGDDDDTSMLLLLLPPNGEDGCAAAATSFSLSDSATNDGATAAGAEVSSFKVTAGDENGVRDTNMDAGDDAAAFSENSAVTDDEATGESMSMPEEEAVESLAAVAPEAAAGSCAHSIEKGDISSPSESAVGAETGAGEANDAMPHSAALSEATKGDEADDEAVEDASAGVHGGASVAADTDTADGDMASAAAAVIPIAGDSKADADGDEARAAGSGERHTLSMSALTSVQSVAAMAAGEDAAVRALGDSMAIAAAAATLHVPVLVPLMVRSGVRAGDLAETTTTFCRGEQEGGCWTNKLRTR
jgi:hypothetical protein